MNWEITVREIVVGRPIREHTVFQIARPSRLIRFEDLGIRLEEGKTILANIQNVITTAQAEFDSHARRTCPACGKARRMKDYRRRRIDTMFGQVSVRLKRTTAGCTHEYAEHRLPPGRSTPEFDSLRAKVASELPYRKARAFLGLTLPVSAGLAPGTIRAHTFWAGYRLAPTDAAATNGLQSAALTLGLDTAFIRSCSRESGRHLPVVVGEVTTASGDGRIFAAVDDGEDSESDVIRDNLQAQGLTPRTAVTVFTDGEERLRLLARKALRRPIAPVLDWFHIAMRIQHIRQLSRGLTTQLPSHAEATRVVREELDAMRWRLWNGRADAVDGCLGRVSEAIGAFRRYPPNRRTRMAISGLFTMLHDLRRYVRGNAHLIIDFASARRAGHPISTARVESAVNRLVNRRMNKSQQMRWSPRGAHLLLLVRAAVLNGEFDERRANAETRVENEVQTPMARAA
jgi:hypothetical protein